MDFIPYDDSEVQNPSDLGGGSFSYGADQPLPPEPPKKITVPNVDVMGNPTGGEQEIEVPAPRKYEDLPTVASMPDISTTSRLGIPLANTPEGIANILKKNDPDIKFSSDMYGNPTAVKDGKAYHLDYPGINKLSTEQFLEKGLVSAPFFAGAALAGGPVSAPLTGAVAGGASTYATNYLANLAGAQEPLNLSEVGFNTLLGAAAPIGGRILSKAGPVIPTAANLESYAAGDAFNQLSRGTQTLLLNNGEKLRLMEAGQPFNSASDLVLDNPEFKGVAQDMVAQNTPTADSIISTIKEREAARPQRVMSDVDQNIGQQTINEREMAQLLNGYKGVLSGELKPILDNAPPIDPSGVVAKIDDMLPTAKGDIKQALTKIRGMLVNKEGTPGTGPSVNPIIDPKTGNFIRNERIPATPATPPVYETSAEGLENARVAIDRMIKYGYQDGNVGLIPNAAKNPNVTAVRNSLSDLLKKQVPGYEDVMGKYSNIYDQMFANQRGDKLFAKGEDATHPELVQSLMNDPVTRDAFIVGARGAVNNVLTNSPSEMSGLVRAVGGNNANSVIRTKLETVFGPDAVDNLVNLANREQNYKNTASSLESTYNNSRVNTGTNVSAQTREPIFTQHPVQQLYQAAVAQPANIAAEKVLGRTGPSYEKSMGDFLTAPASELPKYKTGYQNALKARGTAVGTSQAINPLISGPASQTFENKDNNEARGGRIERKHGGKVGHQHLVDRLMRLAERAKKEVNKGTEPLLNANDTAVAKALAVANKHI